jgi:hypothetical protein
MRLPSPTHATLTPAMSDFLRLCLLLLLPVVLALWIGKHRQQGSTPPDDGAPSPDRER